MNAKKVLKTSILLSTLSLCFMAHSESFRIRKTHILGLSDIEITETEQSQEIQTAVSAGINDGICIILPEDMTFIQGIELNIKIPQTLTKYPNSVIYTVYDSISPVPQAKTIDYTGKEIYTGIYPGLVSLKIQIPVTKNNSIRQTPYADKTAVPDISRRFIFIRNQLAMKGISKEAMESKYIVTAKPIYIYNGKLTLTTIPSKPENLTVTIDEKITELDKNGSCFLKPGAHTVNVSADGYRNENWSVMIETAKETKLALELQSIAPTLELNMPQGTKVSVDNQNIDVKGSFLELSPGEHIIKFTLGGYEVVKKVTIQEGRSYSMDVVLDADFIEN